VTTTAHPRPSVSVAGDRPATGRARTWLGHAYWLLPVLLAGLIVRYQAARPQLWRDELATWWAARLSFGDLGRLTGHIDGVLAPYYALMHVWTGLFGDSTLALRLPSVLAAAATAGVVAALGGLLHARLAGVLGGVLYALLPATSRYGQEARPYALAGLAAASATLLLLLALRKQRWFWWVGYAVAVAALGALHLLALLLLTGHVVAVLTEVLPARKWRTLAWAAGAMAAGVAPLIPLALRGRGQLGQQLGTWIQTPDFFTVLDLPAGVFGAAIVGGMLLALAAAGAFGGTRPLAVFGLLTLTPVVVFAVLGQFMTVFHPRYLLFVAPLACVLAGQALARLGLPGALAIVLLVGLTGLDDQNKARRSHDGSAPLNYRAAARVIEQNERPGDVIVYLRTGWQFADLGMEYYLHGDTPEDVLAVTGRRAVGSYWTPETTDPDTALKGRDRVWVVLPDNLSPRRKQALPPITQAALDGTPQTWRVTGITVQLYQAG
jgi:mannosyltransferase